MKVLIFLLVLVCTIVTLQASLSVRMDEPKATAGKVVVKLTIKNTFTNAVESARASVFLVDDKGKAVGQNTQWVIGGNKDKPRLAPQGTATYYMSISTDKPFQKANVMFSRIILEGGKVIEAGKGYTVEKN